MKVLMEGSHAIAEAAIQAGCRFYAGYPITPSTEILEYMSHRLPQVGGVCMNAESEIEAINMVWGAAGCGVRAMIASTGQGISLMQESLAELANAQLPCVVVNMMRGQGDYYQATRGGGHGDYRHVVLAPVDVREAVELTQLAFHLADRWRNPVQIYGDFLLVHTSESVDVSPREFGALPAKDWAVDGSLGGSGRSRNVNPIGMGKGVKGIDPQKFWQRLADKHQAIEREEQRFEASDCDDADLVVVAFGSLARFARHVVRELRAQGARVGFFRPITLWPFPAAALASAATGARRIAVLEQNAGQMIDDVRLAVLGAVPVEAIGGISSDEAGFGVGDIYSPADVRRRVEGVMR